MNKITLICTSWNPKEELLNKMLRSARGFDEIVLHIDAETKIYPEIASDTMVPIRLETHSDHLDIGKAYNMLIERTPTEWVCCMCDDDYFDKAELEKAIELVNMCDESVDVIHFPVHVWGDVSYHRWGSSQVIMEEMKAGNKIPAGAFFRKSAWEKAGGFDGEVYHDWILWLKMMKAGCSFKYFDGCVYWFQVRPNTAASRQVAGLKDETALQHVLKVADV
jgi:glycosyltransferase involved in cell wall biosynthesis